MGTCLEHLHRHGGSRSPPATTWPQGQQVTPASSWTMEATAHPEDLHRPRGESKHPPASIHVMGDSWTPPASTHAMGQPGTPVPLGDRPLSPASPSPGDIGVGTRGSQTGCATTLPAPSPGVGEGTGAVWGGGPVPTSSWDPVGQAGLQSRQGRRTISYLDNSTRPGPVSAGEWAARSFPLRVKAPGRLMAVKGAGWRETAGGQEGGKWTPSLLHSHPSAHP